jgi:hypothetical protein
LPVHWCTAHMMTTRMRTRLLLTALLVPVLATSAACTKANDGKDVASVGATTAPTPSATAGLSHADLAVRWARCMREHGVPVSDPVINGDTVREGRIEPHFPKDQSDAAKAACQQYKFQLPVGASNPKQDIALQEARCMREHGVEAFPDPNPEGGTRIPAEATDDPQFGAAQAVCRAQANSAFASMSASPR